MGWWNVVSECSVGRTTPKDNRRGWFFDAASNAMCSAQDMMTMMNSDRLPSLEMSYLSKEDVVALYTEDSEQ